MVTYLACQGGLSPNPQFTARQNGCAGNILTVLSTSEPGFKNRNKTHPLNELIRSQVILSQQEPGQVCGLSPHGNWEADVLPLNYTRKFV